MQLTSQTVDKLQNAAGFGFDDRLHDQFAAAIEDSDHNRFVVHIQADIFDVVTHAVACLRERTFALNGVFPSRQSVILWRICPYLLLRPVACPLSAAGAERSHAQRSGAKPAHISFALLNGPLSHNALTRWRILSGNACLRQLAPECFRVSVISIGGTIAGAKVSE